MAFLKYANAKLEKAGIQFAEWESVRGKALSPAPDFQKRTAKVILEEYDPSKYMLSHATIVASVDVDHADAPIGKHYVEGFEIDRQYPDYYVSPQTAQYINNNHDCFERKLLLTTFKSFIGAQSYVEHVQLPELSKGRIIDAAARDIGDSVYIDILIANDLKHAPLIKAIKSGQLGTLSMGCSTSSTTCTKCGNVAQDETQLCACIRFFKGQEFIDELGVKRKVAELCGHYSDPDSVKFIEASWVANPAFKGAVLRSVLTAEEVNAMGTKLHMAFSTPAPEASPNNWAKAARQAVETVSEPDKEDDKPKKQKRQDFVDNNRQNESLIRSAMDLSPVWRKVAKFVVSNVGQKQAKRIVYGLMLHKQGGWDRVKTAGFTGKEILALSRVIDRMTKKSSQAGETRVYRTVLSVGGTAPYEDDETYLAACRQVLGRVVTGSEASELLEKGRLFALGRSK